MNETLEATFPCEECDGRGRIYVGNSGLDIDGNAPVFETCHACDGRGKHPVEPPSAAAETPAGSETPETDAHLSHLNLPDGRKIGIPNETVAMLRSLESRLTAGQKELEDAKRLFADRMNEMSQQVDDANRGWRAAQKERDEANEVIIEMGQRIDQRIQRAEVAESDLAAERGRREVAEQELGQRIAAMEDYHCESEGCMVPDGLDKKATIYRDKFHDYKRRAEQAEARATAAEREAKRWKASDECNSENFRVTNTALVKYDRERLDAVARAEQAEARTAELEKNAIAYCHEYARKAAKDKAHAEGLAAMDIAKHIAALARPAKGGRKGGWQDYPMDQAEVQTWMERNPGIALNAYYAEIDRRKPKASPAAGAQSEDKLRISEQLREAAGVRSDTDAWLMVQAADAIEACFAANDLLLKARKPIAPPGGAPVFWTKTSDDAYGAFISDGMKTSEPEFFHCYSIPLYTSPQPRPAAQERAAELEKDAARYQWLRSSPDWEPFDTGWISRISIYGGDPEDMDNAIDALARPAKGGQG